MSRTVGVHVMSVASRITGMHPQTLRKYERARLVSPSRSGPCRVYSDEDLERLRMIKYLVDGIGLNLAGVNLAMRLREKLQEICSELDEASIDHAHRRNIEKLLKAMEESLGVSQERR